MGAVATKQLPLPTLIDCLWDRVKVTRAIGRGVPLGDVDELIAQAAPYLPTHPLLRALVQELEASRA